MLTVETMFSSFCTGCYLCGYHIMVAHTALTFRE